MVVICHLIKALLDHRLVRLPTGSHELCTLVLNRLQFFLQPVDLLLEPLEEITHSRFEPVELYFLQ